MTHGLRLCDALYRNNQIFRRKIHNERNIFIFNPARDTVGTKILKKKHKAVPDLYV